MVTQKITKRLVCFDIGEKTLGVSISDELRIIPIPYKNYFIERFSIEEIINITKQIESNLGIDLLIIGYPSKTDGRTATIATFIDEVISALKKNFSFNLIKQDERFSTQRGLELIKEKKLSPEKEKEVKDVLASYVMLYDFMNSH